MSSKQQLICITGADGTGKSTVVKAIVEKYPQSYAANIWDLMDDQQGVLFRSRRDIDGYLCALTPDSRLLFLAHALKYSTEKALKSSAEIILLNAYWYKYFATESALGASVDLVRNLSASFPEPDMIVRLTLPVRLTAQRKEKYSRYECGATGKNEISDFIRFQETVAPYWQKFENKSWISMDASQSIEQVVQQTLSALQL